MKKTFVIFALLPLLTYAAESSKPDNKDVNKLADSLAKLQITVRPKEGGFIKLMTSCVIKDSTIISQKPKIN